MQQNKPIGVALLGDSTIHNDSYVPQGHTVLDYVFDAMDKKVNVTRYARDGAVMDSIAGQLEEVDWENTTHMVVSISGNDLLGIRFQVYQQQCGSVRDALVFLDAVKQKFSEAYEQLAMGLQRLCEKHDVELALCTVYRGNAYTESDQMCNRTAVAVFNSVITGVAMDLGLAVIDNYTLFSEDEDFANPIEPSAQGGWKFAQAVREFVTSPPPAEGLVTTQQMYGGFVDRHGRTFPVQAWQQVHSGISWADVDYGTATVPLRSETDQTEPEQRGEGIADSYAEHRMDHADTTEPLELTEVAGDPMYNWGKPESRHPHTDEQWATGGH